MNLMSLQYKVQIQQQSTDCDAAGQPLQTWTTIAEPMADIRTLGGLETVKAGAETSIIKASIRLWYRTDITAGMRVVHGSTVYNIKAVLPDMVRRLHVDLVCEAAQ